jgi:hypothetical protein
MSIWLSAIAWCVAAPSLALLLIGAAIEWWETRS